MKVTTSALLPAAPADVWPLLCGSTMNRDTPCLFRFGVPKPVECRLPAGAGAAGARRECISNQGRVQQRILRWEPPSLLTFEMVETDLFFSRYVSAIEERFDLHAEGVKTRIVRTTRVSLQPGRSVVRALQLHVGLKQVHRYVFRNWVETLRRRADPVAADAA